MSEKVLSYEQLVMKYADKVASIAFVHKTTEEQILHDIWKKLNEDDTDEWLEKYCRENTEGCRIFSTNLLSAAKKQAREK